MAIAPGVPVTALVVDDGAIDRRIVGVMIERGLGWRVLYADDGRAALAVLAADRPQVVLTDLNMPGMDGLALVAAVRRDHPLVPVVLMTAFGNEEVALQALQAGAASYVPKQHLGRDLTTTLERVHAAAQVELRQQRLLDHLTDLTIAFTLDNDRTLVPALVAHVGSYLAPLGLSDPTGRTRVGIALEETLLNAILHGNLEVSSDLRQQGDAPFYRQADERRGRPPYRDRRVRCTARLSRAEAVFVVRDDGPGFDPGGLPDPTDPANLERVGGRGLLLIRTFMDEVRFNPAGNEITLIKRREPGRASAG